MKFDVVRAWKDASYLKSLSSEEQAMLPVSPAGEFELSEADLEIVNGASGGGAQTIINSLATAAACLQSDAGPCITIVGNCFNSAGN